MLNIIVARFAFIGYQQLPQCNWYAMADPKGADTTIEKFIELVRAHPILYDLKQMGYHDEGAKNNVWERISVDCGLTGTNNCSCSTIEYIHPSNVFL